MAAVLQRRQYKKAPPPRSSGLTARSPLVLRHASGPRFAALRGALMVSAMATAAPPRAVGCGVPPAAASLRPAVMPSLPRAPARRRATAMAIRASANSRGEQTQVDRRGLLLGAAGTAGLLAAGGASSCPAPSPSLSLDHASSENYVPLRPLLSACF